jgi:hypothetical protein
VGARYGEVELKRLAEDQSRNAQLLSASAF